MSALYVEQSTVRHRTVCHSTAHNLSYHISRKNKHKNKGVQTVRSRPSQTTQIKRTKGPKRLSRQAGWTE